MNEQRTTTSDKEELLRLTSEIVSTSMGYEQPNTLVMTTEQHALTVALLKVTGWPRAGRRRSRHCRSSRPRALRRAMARARGGTST